MGKLAFFFCLSFLFLLENNNNAHTHTKNGHGEFGVGANETDWIGQDQHVTKSESITDDPITWPLVKTVLCKRACSSETQSAARLNGFLSL